MSRFGFRARSSMIVLALAAMIGTTAAHAESWSLGSHLSLMSLNASGGGPGQTLISVPDNVLGIEPGFRIGVGDDHHENEALFDIGYLHSDVASESGHIFVGMFSYQHTFNALSKDAAFVNGGFGVFHASGGTSENSIGGGLGFRHRVGEDHGAVRAEVRLVHWFESSESAGLNSIGLRLGFDLWLGSGRHGTSS